jgi:hypothetical protein
MYDQYGAKIELVKEAIIPDKVVFDDVDWLVGNHSDEVICTLSKLSNIAS